ncbi:LOW QUALITY PROTEIN: glutathione S-transferase U10-like [Spinacia oleracea]|uniref:Glutathione S-transferase n=1 Tax=Spinacia oleracea TaxID=3562 RepID=A0A9R0K7I0_SPIOL|nr:LOW QUALITY PROTEIN: glutathione S-transferase U10-like [Spinacia oleracea]
MESKDNNVRLHGMWASIYSKRVEYALKIKGIPYEYIEEDLINKSQALVEYNPVHKKVPVLVHNGKPLAESLVILEYIDEAWPTYTPRLLPDDPYERARVRFWASFLTHQLPESAKKVFFCSGEAQDQALQELHDKLTMMEHEMTEFIPIDVNSVTNESLGILDINLVTIFASHKAQEEVLGKKILDPEKHPLLYSWVAALTNLPVIKESIPPSHDTLVAALKKWSTTPHDQMRFI